MNSEVRLYTTSFCGFCVRAKQLLGREKIPYTEVNLDGDQTMSGTRVTWSYIVHFWLCP